MDAPHREAAEPSPLALPDELQQSLLYPSPPPRSVRDQSGPAGDDLFDRLLVGMTAAERRKHAARRRRRWTLLVLMLVATVGGIYYGGESAVDWTKQRLPQLSAWLHDTWESVRHSR